MLALATIALSVEVEEDVDKVQLEEGEEFIVSCNAGAKYQYCNFKSPSGQFCNFERKEISDTMIQQFCDGLENRVIFVGSYEDHECALLVGGAEREDGGHWTCEVGSGGKESGWALTGDINIDVILHRTTLTTSHHWKRINYKERFPS